MVSQRRGRALGWDLVWHGLQVFLASLLVTTSAGDYITRLRTLAFWQEVSGAALTAAVSQLLNYAAIRIGRQAGGCGRVGRDAEEEAQGDGVR